MPDNPTTRIWLLTPPRHKTASCCIFMHLPYYTWLLRVGTLSPRATALCRRNDGRGIRSGRGDLSIPSIKVAERCWCLVKHGHSQLNQGTLVDNSLQKHLNTLTCMGLYLEAWPCSKTSVCRGAPTTSRRRLRPSRRQACKIAHGLQGVVMIEAVVKNVSQVHLGWRWDKGRQ